MHDVACTRCGIAGTRGDAVGLWDPGGTPGDAAGPSPALLASGLETSGSSISAWGQAMLLGHTQGRALFPRQAPRCPGSTPGCRQQHCAQVPPCMAGSQGGGEQALGAPSTRKAPQAAMSWLCPICFPPLCSQLRSTLRAPSPCPWPWAPQNCCHPSPIPGGSTAGPPGARAAVAGRGCVFRPSPAQASQTALCSCFAGSRPGAGAGWSGRLTGSGCAD